MANEKEMTKAVEQAATAPASEKFTLDYVLAQIEKIAEQTNYLHETIHALSEIHSNMAGDIATQAKAQALGDVVKCRETTNQQMLRMYEKMYEQFMPSKQSSVSDILQTVRELFKDCDVTTIDERSNALDTLRQILKESHF